ncbi:HlyD family secretion protein [Mangrovicoccus algicola]|uniref:HlyD family secretion protein n=1 Tax=Mangrovicoccus algicola TaxID=2771008 RepID=A0A8J6YVB6_9RHOB|nr:HlyD family secretion protein [Mangrovicoccus algicola]MBE3636844.1 HlyD family secretion protein [Mangrovicoccus algicola]
MTLLKHHVPTLLVVLIGLLGVGTVLYAWQLPPFAGTEIRTENAYVRGSVTTISPQIAGYVTQVPVSDFQVVTAGEVLVRLDDRTAAQALAQAEAALAGARAALKANAQDINSAEAVLESRKAARQAAEAALDTAQAAWARQDKLKAKGFLSQSDADDGQLSLQQAQAALTEAESNVDVAREDVASARVQTDTLQSQIASAEAAVELARIDLEHTVIHAPRDGQLGQIGVKPGQYVTAGAALMSHVAPQVWVIANVKERELADMAQGQAVRFTVDALRDRSFTGRVSMLSPATASEYSVLGSSAATGNFTKIAQRLPVRIEIDPGQEGAESLAPGMSVVLHAPRQGG